MVSTLALGHMVVDGLSIFTAMRVATAVATEDSGWVILLYGTLAFATQTPLGWLVDRLKLPAVAAGLGMAMATLAAALWESHQMPALWVAGLGNALYHVGGGSLSLSQARGRAAHGGVFVGPGDLGVVLGTYIGLGWWPGAIPLVVAGSLMLLATLVVAPRRQEVTQSRPGVLPKQGSGLYLGFLLTAGLLLLAVACRQLVGGKVGGPWLLQAPTVWLAISALAMLGKMAFGFVADRWGWMRVAVPLSMAAVPLVAITGHAGASLCAAVLVQSAMPVTLGAMARMLPQRPGLAFGLASSSLWLGALPALLHWKPWPALCVAGAQLVAAIAIAVALWRLGNAERGTQNREAETSNPPDSGLREDGEREAALKGGQKCPRSI
jgi:MFS transporter, FSR family, fosmidomycin resistance protein